jgi:hypothetical protein
MSLERERGSECWQSIGNNWEWEKERIGNSREIGKEKKGSNIIAEGKDKETWRRCNDCVKYFRFRCENI